MLGLGISLPQVAVRSNLFDPRSLFRAGEQGVVYDPSDFSTLFQDSAGTTPVTGVGQPVGLMRDKSGRGNHATQPTAASRPILQQDGAGRYYLSCDGVDDGMVTGNIDFTGTNKVTVWVGLTKAANTIKAVCELGAGDLVGSFGLFSNTGIASDGSYQVNLAGGGPGNTKFLGGYLAPRTDVISIGLDLSKADNVLGTSFRVNAVANAGAQNSAAVMGGNFGNYPLYLFRRNGTSLSFQGNFYGLIIRGAASNAAQIAGGERWTTQRTVVSP